MIHCKKCLTVFTNSVGSGTVLCKECQAKGDPDIFDTQPTCGELSCDECNERYAKAVNRIAVLEEVFRKLQMHTKPMADSDGKFVDSKHYSGPCRKCKKENVVTCSEWDSSCGGYTDYMMTCSTCGHVWWHEGSDS